MDKLITQKFREKSRTVQAIQLKNNKRSIMDALLFLDIIDTYDSMLLEINKVEKKGYIEVSLGKEHEDIICYGDWIVQDEYGYLEIYSDEEFKRRFEKKE